MTTQETTLHTTAMFSEDGGKRYLLQKVWSPELPKLAIIMLAPSIASGIQLDNSTLLVLNNASRLGFGSVDVLNLFASLGDFSLKQAETEDPENMDVILHSCALADTIVYAPGVGKSKNKLFAQRQEQVLSALSKYEEKLHCLSNANGSARLQHPLSPAVRTWTLSPLKVSELLPAPSEPEPKQKKKGRSKTI